MLLMLVTTFFLLWMIHHWLSLRKLLNLPTPGICLPVFGHFYLFMNNKARQDPVGCLSKLWKTHQKGGVLWFRRFASDILLVGVTSSLLECAETFQKSPTTSVSSGHGKEKRARRTGAQQLPTSLSSSLFFSELSSLSFELLS